MTPLTLSPYTLRSETAADYAAVEALVKSAFEHAPHSDGSEHLLVARLRASAAFIPALSIVAEHKGELVGYILLTSNGICSQTQCHTTLALAPLAVLPSLQRQGVGTALMGKAHAVAKKLGYGSIIVLGDPAYYGRFGYLPCSNFGITLPFEAPAEYMMAKELTPDSLKEISGEVCYDPAFGV